MAIEAVSASSQDPSILRAIRSPNGGEFGALLEPHRRALHVHCYRMLASVDDADDAVQETFLRAWKARRTFDGRSSVRTWLYRIATNASIDLLNRRGRRGRPGSHESVAAAAEVPWLQPYPDAWLEAIAPPDEEPEAIAVARETIELAFIVALQHLPPRQRAVLIACDVLDLRAREAAELLDLSVPSVTSALQRARASLRQRLPNRAAGLAALPPGAPSEGEVIRRYIDAATQLDMTSLAALLHEDARNAMPPQPDVGRGRSVLMGLWSPIMVGPGAWGEWRYVPTFANRQPAVAAYLRRPGRTAFRAMAIDVMRIEGGLITDIITFNRMHFSRFGLPERLQP
jgi:RNA polymerase sigma-70 factor (ECF subfamily)